MEAIAIPQALLDSPLMAVKSRGKKLIQEARARQQDRTFGWWGLEETSFHGAHPFVLCDGRNSRT